MNKDKAKKEFGKIVSDEAYRGALDVMIKLGLITELEKIQMINKRNNDK